MRECMICGTHQHVLRCEKVQLCTRCAEVLWEALYAKLHPEHIQQQAPEEKAKKNDDFPQNA